MSPRKKKKKKNTIFKIAISVLVLALTAALIIVWRYYSMIEKPNVELQEGKKFIYISTGSDYNDVLSLLEKENVLKKTSSFNWVAEQKNYPGKVKPGKYLIKSGMSNNELVNLLRSGEQVPVKVTFHNIHTLSELSGAVAKNLEHDSLHFYNVLTNDSIINHYGFTRRTFAAMFIPDTYEMYWNSDGYDFTAKMARAFKQYWNEERKNKASTKGLSQTEVATLASIVQEETRHKDEMPVVAGLYINRLNRGMKLQADPTVKFAAGDPEMKRIYFKHLEIESPYNTYKHGGLPPGPIGFPEKQALDAVLNAQEHSYIFMCAKPDFSGYHNFAETLLQHNRNRQKYLAFLRQQGIR